MTILALEFSSARRSVALARGGEVLAETVEPSGLARGIGTDSAVVRPGTNIPRAVRGTNAFGLIGTALANAKISRAEIEVIAVGLGPGSYTGIRAAIALAQGWQLARGVKLLGVSSLAGVAAEAQARDIFGRVHLAVDAARGIWTASVATGPGTDIPRAAQRGEFYLATWEISSGQRREISPLRIVAASEIAARQAAGEICAGPERERVLFPSAAMTARLAEGRTDFLAGDRLEPVYLRATSFVKAPARRVF